MLISDYLLAAVAKDPDKLAIIHGAEGTTYQDLLKASNSIARWLLAAGEKPGFRGAILSDDPLEYIASYFGILLAGGVAVGLNTQTTEQVLTHTLNDCEASSLLLSGKYARYLPSVLSLAKSVKTVATSGGSPTAPGATRLAGANLSELITGKEDTTGPLPFRSSCDYAQIIYTSGTTGKPKGVVLRHANLEANITSIVSYLGLTASDRVMAVLPFFYSYGNSVLLTHIAVGGSLVVNQSFLYPNVILQQMLEYGVTGFSGVPSTYALLLHRSAIEQYHFPSLRYITQAGAAMSPQLAKQLQAVFPATKIYIMYGQTEASARLTYLEPEELQRRPGSIGKAIPGVSLSLLNKQGQPVVRGEVGEIVVRGDNIMAGYWGKPDETKAVLRAEGLHTGDLAREDEEGFLFIVGRKSEMIKSGSHRISPKEIEDALAEHPAVHEAAVIGVNDQILGERICACLVLKEDAACTEKEIIRFCRSRLQAYKVPHQVRFLSSLPKTATGKIQKNELQPDRRSGDPC